MAGVLVAGIAVAYLVLQFIGGGDTPETIPLSEALIAIEDGDVDVVSLDDGSRTARLELADGEVVSTTFPVGYGTDLVDAATAAGVEVDATPYQAPSTLTRLFYALLPAMLIVGLLIFVLTRGGGGGMLNVAKLPTGRGDAVNGTSVRFDDIAGNEEVLDDLREVVSYLNRDASRFTRVGANVPTGFLLVGPPGTGKTLLAKAVAGEAGVPFFAMSGSDFVETFVGVGARRIRDVFAEARKHPRAIVFIDELDAVGRARTVGPSNGSNEESERTLNALLVELDGFHDSGVIVLGATNRPEILDSALLRPGRFDRRIMVGLPDRAARADILRLHLAKRPVADDVDIDGFARRCVGCSGADLAFLANEAALAAGRENADQITLAHLEVALSTSMLGRVRKSAVRSEQDRRITAFHEAGHALVALVDDDLDDPVAVSILPRGNSGGVTWLDSDDQMYVARTRAEAQLAMLLGGRAGEMILLGGDFTSGASSDLAQAKSLAGRMVNEWGMGESLVQANVKDGDREAAAMVDTALERARHLLATHRDLFEAIASELLEVEELDGARLAELRTRF